jgi:hypothetical protein
MIGGGADLAEGSEAVEGLVHLAEVAVEAVGPVAEEVLAVEGQAVLGNILIKL